MEPARAADAVPNPTWFSRSLFLVVIFAVLIRIFFWAYTGRTWEDALITVLHSENAVHGLGLTHVKPGEPPLHGFTSPLSVLVPLAGDLIHAGFGLTLLKILSAIMGGLAAWLGARLSLAIGIPHVLALAVAAYLSFEHHQILWGMAGMETEMVTVAYLWSIYCLLRGTQWQKGLSLGITMLARPDAAFWVAIAVAIEGWRAWRTGDFKRLTPVFAGFVLVYGPWVIFTNLYYGSPVPNTILAKSMGYASVSSQLGRLPILAKMMFVERRFLTVFATLGPSYGGNGTGFQAFRDNYYIAWAAVFLMVLGAYAAMRRRHSAAMIVFTFVGVYALYLTLVANFIFGWYTAPIAAVGAVAAGYGLSRLIEVFVGEKRRNAAAWAISAVWIFSLAAILPATMTSDKYIQQYVEEEGRGAVGKYIASISQPTDTIASESLGYVGYYSRRPVLDYPGMCSRRVVQYLRDYPKERSLVQMMYHLRPTFLVLRSREYLNAEGQLRYPWIAEDYELKKQFIVPPEKRARILYPESNIDFEFAVWEKKNTGHE
jgi:hypothetical protein